jgi:predicted O-linked N-acetylglucosamine transferase (SPINDLY family)
MTQRRMHELNLAEAALKAGDYEKAGGLFEVVVSAQPECHQAWFGLGDLAFRIGDYESAGPLLEHAANLSPKVARYKKRLGEWCCRVGQIEPGIVLLGEAVALAPDDTEIACALSGAHVAAGNWGEAKKILNQVVRRKGALAAHYCLRGMASQHLGELDDALADFKTAARLDNGYGDAWLSLADVYRVRGELDKAAPCAQQALKLMGDSPVALNLCGDIELAQGNSRGAADYFKRATVFKADSPELWAKLGVALVQSGDTLPAIDALEKAHELGVAEDWIYEHMGLLFTTRGQLEVARENLELAVNRQPENLNAWNTLIVVYTKLGQSEKARQAAETVLAIDPEHLNALLNLGSWYSDQARNEEALIQYRKALAVNPKSATAYVNSLWVLVHSSEATAADVLAMAREFDRNLCLPHHRSPTFANLDRSPGRRLRIGWLTSDFRTHPVAAFVLPFIDKFDPALVENYAYYNSAASDEITQRSRGAVDVWRDVVAIGDEALADLIEADRIDILVDLNGNTEGNRLLAVARKPAPIVVTWLGFPGTSGMSAVDYIVVPPDPVLEAGTWCSETPWPLPDCYGVRTGIPDVPIQPGLPCERTGKPFTFGCLNNFRKVSQQAIGLWSEILQQVPESRLVVVARGGTEGSLVGYIHDQFGRYGIAPERIDIRGIQPQLAYFNSYNEIDLCLDPFPFNGGTTGYDSIWMGVPFVTWPGDMLVSRMGKAILDNVQLSELVASSREDYVRRAVALAGNREHLKALRAGLRERMLSSPLMDAPRLARHLEQAFREMWQRWCGTGAS